MPGRLLSFSDAAANATKKILNKSAILNPHNVQHGKRSKSSSSKITPSLNSSNSLLSVDETYYASDPESMDLLKRHSISLTGRSHRHRDKSSTSNDVAVPEAASLSMVVESPPLISHGSPEESSGALFSGQLKLQVLQRTQTFKNIQVKLLCSTTFKRPIAHCTACGGRTQDLQTWNFTPQPLVLDAGEHKFPISYLFKGNLPASSHSKLAMLDYHFIATVETTDGAEPITFTYPVVLQRAIRPGNERQSIRVFPPTNMTAHITISPVCYTDSEIPVKMRLSGIKTSTDKTITRWRLRRLLWRIEEHQKIASPACPKHAHKVPEGKSGYPHEEVRVIGESEVSFSKNPWKTDLSEGNIEAEFVATLNPNKKAICGVVDESINLNVYHHLVLEMIVVEEYVQKKKPTQPTPTGAARILRSQFPLRVTNRAGLGIAWDEETPPVYQDVPMPPPNYPAGAVRAVSTTPGLAQVTEIDLAEIGDGIDDLHLGEPHELARAIGLSSGSTVRRGSGSSSEAAMSYGIDPPEYSPQVIPRGAAPLRLSADDFALEPLEFSNRRDEEQEEIDIETVRAAGR